MFNFFASLTATYILNAVVCEVSFFPVFAGVYILNAVVCDVITARERRRIRKENNKKLGIN